MRRPENGFRILDRVAEDLKDIAEVTDRPRKMVGRDLPMILTPLAGFKSPAAKRPKSPPGPLLLPARLAAGLDAHFLEQVVRAVYLVHDPEDVADIDVDRARDLLVEIPVRVDRLVVPIEEKPDQFGIGIEGRRAGVAAGRVHRGQKIHRHGPELGVSVASKALWS